MDKRLAWLCAIFVLLVVGFYPVYTAQSKKNVFVPAQYKLSQEKSIVQLANYKIYIARPRIIAIEDINFGELSDLSVFRDLSGEEVDLVLYSFDKETRRALFLTGRALKVDDSQEMPQWVKKEIPQAINDMVDAIIILYGATEEEDYRDHQEPDFNGLRIMEIKADIQPRY